MTDTNMRSKFECWEADIYGVDEDYFERSDMIAAFQAGAASVPQGEQEPICAKCKAIGAAYKIGKEAGKLAAPVEPHDREQDRAHFSDEQFNRWLDDSAADGVTVWDLIKDITSAWHGWDASRSYAAPVPQGEQDLLGCGACGDGCKGGECRVKIESPQPLPEHQEEKYCHCCKGTGAVFVLVSNYCRREACPACRAVPQGDVETRLQRAEKSLISSGFQDLGGELWKPPLGKPPIFIEVPQGEQCPSWISVDERLPYDDCNVLAATSLRMDHTQHIEIARYRSGSGMFNIGPVTHWMPLPLPPKESL